MAKKTAETSNPGYKAPAIHKAFLVLEAVARTPRPLGIVELAEKLEFSKSSTHGIVHALLREGALRQGRQTRKLYLGHTLAELVFSAWHPADVARHAQPIIDRIRDRIDETVFFGVRIRHQVMINAIAEASNSLKISAAVGTTIPLLAAAVGKAFLAEEPPGRIERIIDENGLPGYTGNSIVKREAYLKELWQVRKRGYALDIEEYIAGIRAVAVALNNQRGLPMAIWVVGVSANLGGERIEEIATRIARAAASLREVVDRPLPPPNRIATVNPHNQTRRVP